MTTIVLATPEDAERWREHRAGDCPHCGGRSPRPDHDPDCINVWCDDCAADITRCTLTCVVPEQPDPEYVKKRTVRNVVADLRFDLRRTLVGQQVTLVSQHEAECRGGPARTAGTTATWNGTVTIGTATVVSVVNVFQEEAHRLDCASLQADDRPIPCNCDIGAKTSRLLMDIEATIPERPQ